MAAKRTGKIDWVFDELPPSGARRGGDPAEHAFEHDTSTFVREVIQNSNDQARAASDVVFKFIELSGAKLDEFLAAMSWPNLRKHLSAPDKQSRLGKRLSRSLERIDKSQKLLLLRIEDRGTVGLVGDELSGNSHFRALCKDTLYSHKDSEQRAGGSYGLGKSVLWNFSGISTVLFNSNLGAQKSQPQSPRMIGRAELPSHELEGEWFSGSGWFGERVEAERGHRAESIWGKIAAEKAKSLNLERAKPTGTSILVLGFREPSADTEPSRQTLIKDMRRAAAEYFWPAMILPDRMLRVGFDTDEGGIEWIDVEQIRELTPFLECAGAEHSSSGDLRYPGDIATRELELEIPARLDGTRPKIKGRVLLAVRLAEEDNKDALTSHLALYRGSGMVTRYVDKKNLSIGMRPFHAIVRAGMARSLRTDPSDSDVEAFLRAAEPPGHDQWKSMPALKDTYQRGYKTALDQLTTEINHHLKDLVGRKPVQGTVGPDLLRKRFPIGGKGTAGGAPSAFHFSHLQATFDGERWLFEGEVRPSETGGAWEASIRLSTLGEDGKKIGAITVEALELTDQKYVEVRWPEQLDEGPMICAPAGVKAVKFSGMSVAISDSAALQTELEMEVVGRNYARGET